MNLSRICLLGKEGYDPCVECEHFTEYSQDGKVQLNMCEIAFARRKRNHMEQCTVCEYDADGSKPEDCPVCHGEGWILVPDDEVLIMSVQ